MPQQTCRSRGKASQHMHGIFNKAVDLYMNHGSGSVLTCML